MSRIHLFHTSQVCYVRGCVLGSNDGVHFLNPCETKKNKIYCVDFSLQRCLGPWVMVGRCHAATGQRDG